MYKTKITAFIKEKNNFLKHTKKLCIRTESIWISKSKKINV